MNQNQIEEIEWINSNSSFQIIGDPTQEEIMLKTPVESNAQTRITLRVRNTCGWSERNFFYQNSPTSTCEFILGVSRMVVYPNPTKSDITALFKVECQNCTAEELEKLYPKLDDNSIVVVNDAFGNERLRYIGK